MASERVVYFSKDTQNLEDEPKQKLQRRSTRLTNSPDVRYEPFSEKQFLQEEIQAPSPVQSSEQASSVEVKYLSYLARVIDSAPQGSDSQQIQLHYHQSEYWQVIFECAIYVKKGDYRTNIDDDLILSEISQYLIQGRVHPEAKSEIGKQLMRNGYFLCAYAIATGRKRKSVFIFKYLMQYFLNEFQIETNYEEFNYLMENFVEKQRAQEILNLEIDKTPGYYQDKPNNSENEFTNNRSQIKRLKQKDNQQPIKRPFLVPINNQISQDSRTIILDDLEQNEINQSSRKLNE